MRKQYIVLKVQYDPEYVGKPSDWNWAEVADMPSEEDIQVVGAFADEEIMNDEDSYVAG